MPRLPIARPRFAWALALLLAALWSVAAAAQAPASVERIRFDRWVAEAEGASPAGALACVIDAASLADWVPTEHALAAFEHLAASLEDADAAALAGYLAASLLARGDDLAARDAAFDALGYFHRFSVIGPFANDGMAGFRQILGPEADGPDPALSYAGKLRPVAWRAIDARMPGAFLDLARVLAPSFAAVAYVAVEFDLDRRLDGALGLAVDGAWRAWIDGQPLAELPDDLGGYAVRDRVPVRLEPGTHVLVLKVAIDDPPWGLHVRLLDRDGRPVVVPHRPLSAASPSLAASDAWPRPRTLAERFQPLLDDPDTSADELASVAFALHSLQSADPSEPWMAWWDRARRLEPSGDALLRLARIPRESWEAGALLERAVRASPDPWARVELAQHHRGQLGGEAPSEARTLARELLAEGVPSVRARLLAAEVLRDEMFDHRYAREVAALAAEHPDVPAVLRAHASAWRNVTRPDLLLAALEALVGAVGDRVAHRIQLVDELVAAGRWDEAERSLDDGIARDPWDADLFVRRAELAERRGRADVAQQAWDAALAIQPDDPALWERRGRGLLARGLRSEGQRALEAALERGPQNAVLRDLVTFLDTERTRFWDPWRVEDDELLAMRERVVAADDVEATALVEQQVTEVLAGGLATTWVQQAWLVHSRSGADGLRGLAVSWTPGSELVDVLRLRVFGADGRVRDTFSVAERGPDRGPAAMYFDVRTRVVQPPTLEPGDLLVWEYTVSQVTPRNLFDDYFGSVWRVQGFLPRSLARWVLLSPPGRAFHTNAEELTLATFERTPGDDHDLLVVEGRDIPRVRREPGMPGWSESFEWLSVSTYADWDTLADWYWDLIREQLVASPAIEATVAEIAEAYDDRRERVAAVYRWVIRNIRYVGLEFGIHGYKPYRTSDCHARRFGDCKDTASLMKVMLGLLGIDARIVLVRTSDLGRVEPFPPSLNVFNHAIVHVPEFDLYLDGTAGFSGSSELPVMDQGATVLHIEDGQGGTFTTIPIAPAPTNRVTLEATFEVHESGSTGEVRMERRGAFAADARRQFEAEDQQVERLERTLQSQFPGARVVGASFSDMRDTERSVWTVAELEGAVLVERTEGRGLVRPLGARMDWVSQLAGTESRTLPLRIEHPWVLEQNVQVVLPAGWAPERLPDDRVIETPFGRVEVFVAWESDLRRLAVEARFRLDATDVSVERYPAFRAFVAEAERALETALRFTIAEDAP